MKLCQVSNHQLIISRCLVVQLMHKSQKINKGSWIPKQRSASFKDMEQMSRDIVSKVHRKVKFFYSHDVVFDENNCSGLQKEQDKVDKMVEIDLSNKFPQNTEEEVVNEDQERNESTELKDEVVLRRSN